MAVTIFAPAKINLSLHVGAPREDGRHPLTSVVVFADVGDVLTMEAGAPGLRISGPFARDLDGENLISRALALAGCAARVELEKNLPVASGIGGGSADAAAALRGARALAPHALSEAGMAQIAARLGADVPACLRCQPGWMSGTGETVTPLDIAPLHAVLVNPGVSVPTAPVYRRFDEMGLGADVERDQPPAASDPAALAALRNDLESPAIAIAPAIGVVLRRLRAEPAVALARMSGSGATCFALMADRSAAEAFAARLASEQSSWWVCAARLGGVDAAPQPI